MVIVANFNEDTNNLFEPANNNLVGNMKLMKVMSDPETSSYLFVYCKNMFSSFDTYAWGLLKTVYTREGERESTENIKVVW